MSLMFSMPSAELASRMTISITNQNSSLPTTRVGRPPARSAASAMPQRAASRSNWTRSSAESIARSRIRATRKPAIRMTTPSSTPGSTPSTWSSPAFTRSNASTSRLPGHLHYDLTELSAALHALETGPRVRQRQHGIHHGGQLPLAEQPRDLGEFRGIAHRGSQDAPVVPVQLAHVG